MNLKSLADDVLLANIKKLVQQEREILTVVLHHLREVERRRLFSSLGFSSLYSYAVGALGYSEDQAYRRISAMRLLRDLPQIEEKLQDGTFSLTNLSLAQSLFRKEEKGSAFSVEKKMEILEKLQNKTAREAEKIVLEYSSEPVKFVAERFRPVTADFTEVKFVVTKEL
ncbi:MAG: hypothetical protein K2X47_17330 [Bdellovibrionales bacterium]|nr:hypothetical protein [Bdellovibrionales bacterium]